MDKHVQTIKFFRERIPAFACVPGCHDCCGPVLASTVEMARLPRKNQQEQEAALAALGCPHLGPDGCQVYEERPLICRLFGTTPRLACPNGKRPEVMIAPVIEERVYRYFEQVRHVLV
ncbi:YkgJ family cysteine cluster protein [Collimonas sp. OK307]|uniref:YkgJ family cysteine cluster protein n=1 Tax=Collimonas sp. OK307 TaxID=1801620 RepID=UPI00352A5FE7